jgi:CheY-like chemotaxis protein
MQSSQRSQPKIHRIVICEDNLDQVHTLAMVLKEMGHSVDFAINGYVAYDVIRRFRPDTAILDLGLPGVTGFELAAQIKRDPELAGVRLIAFTGYTDQKYRERAMAVGFEGYYTKPVDPKVLNEIFGNTNSAFTR